MLLHSGVNQDSVELCVTSLRVREEMQINGKSMWDMEVWHALVSKILLSGKDTNIMQLYKRQLNLSGTVTDLAG